jgi:hypothetical protein
MQLSVALGVFLGEIAILVQEAEFSKKLLSLLGRRGIFDTLGLHGINEPLKLLFAQGVLRNGLLPLITRTGIDKISKSSIARARLLKG